MIIILSGAVPLLYHDQVPSETPAVITYPVAEISTMPINVGTVAGEPNFTREGYPFILDNFPQFSWKNPGRFNGSQDRFGNILVSPTAAAKGYDPSLSAPGAGPEKYPDIYNALLGLNESNIRIMYLDADYNWVSVPYQIDQRGWANIWYPADLNKWAGLEPGGSTNLFSNGGGEHFYADPTIGIGWIAGDLWNSEGQANYNNYPGGAGANDLRWEWYRIPTWTYVSPRQADGSITDETLHIDPEYRDNLIWCYMANQSRRPHTAWLGGDSGGYSPYTNDWNANNGTPGNAAIFRNTYPMYHNITKTGCRPCFVNTTTWTDPWVDENGNNNVVFIGDTWFKTPGNYSDVPQWVRDLYPYQQINGALDKDDQICFYTYPGRQALDWLWWNYSYFPNRFELKIVDPIDGGQTWMYIYFNNDTAWNPLNGGMNLGAPKFTTKDAQGNLITDYVNWDPDGKTITTNFYRISYNGTNPSIMRSLQLFGNTDGQSLLSQFNKMYLYGYCLLSIGGQTWSTTWAFGREGIWYGWDNSQYSFTEIICSLDNPTVLFPGMTRDTGQLRAYGNGEWTADRRNLTLAPQCPQNYYGPQGIARGKTPPYNQWEANYGDGQVLIDGPCRIISYLSQYLILGIRPLMSMCGTTICSDSMDCILPLMDGPQFYYQRMQIGAETSLRIPSLSALIIRVYYAYTISGTLNSAIRKDFNFTAGQEWAGGADGIDQHEPKFGWANQYGWSKIRGLNPKTTGFNILGFSIPDPACNLTNYYQSQGNPLLHTDPITNPLVCPPDGNNLNLPDWLMITSETHGGVWMYIPRRELNECRDNNNYAGPNCQPKMYFRDDIRKAEFGICLDGGANPYMQGGTTSSPYHMMMVYGEFKDQDAIQLGHKLYCNYYFPVEAIGTLSACPMPGPQFIYESVQPEKLIYKTGETIDILVRGSPLNATITANLQDIDINDSNINMTNSGDGTWTLAYYLDSVIGASYNRYIKLTAKVPGQLWINESIFYLNLTIDNTAPSPTAELKPLTGNIIETAVLLEWTATPGFDKGCSSMENPSGLGHYTLRRGTVSGVYDIILADNIPISTTHFVDSLIENNKSYYYRLDTYDTVGNFNQSSEYNISVDLPFTPAQPADLPTTKNSSDGIFIDWTQNPGSVVGAITSYHVYFATTIAGPYIDVSGQLGNTTKIWTFSGPFSEASIYYFKVATESDGKMLYSSPVYTKIDDTAPTPAEIATPFPIYTTYTPGFIVSWATEVLPEYERGGFPGHDLNGIDHWIVWKKVGTDPWNILATVPYSPIPEGQRILDVDIFNSTSYSYSIQTFDTAGNSAYGQYNKTTTVFMRGPGVAVIYSVSAERSVLIPGTNLIPVSVRVRNSGAIQIILNQVKLLFLNGTVNVTSDYSGIVQTPNEVLPAYTDKIYVFNVNVSQDATLGKITIKAQTQYDFNKSYIGALTPDSWVLLIDTTPPFCFNERTSLNSPQNYIPHQQYQFNLTIIDNVELDTVLFEWNGMNYTGSRHSETEYWYAVFDLGVGIYPYRWFFNDTSNKWNATSLKTYLITPNPTGLNIFFNGTAANYQIDLNQYCNITIIFPISEIVYFFVNGMFVSNQSAPLSNISQYTQIAIYNITAYHPGSQNYTAMVLTRWLNVVDRIPPSFQNISHIPSNPIYLQNQIYQFNCTWTDDWELDAVVLEFNGRNYTDILNVSTEYFRAFIDLPANEEGHRYRWLANDTSGNWAGTPMQIYIIGRKDPDFHLLMNSSSNDLTIKQWESVNISAVLAESSNIGNFTILINGNLTDTNIFTNQIKRDILFAKAGIYNISCIFAGNKNLTTDLQSYLLTVTDIEPPQIIHFSNRTYLNCTALEYWHSAVKISVYVADNDRVSYVSLCENSTGIFVNRTLSTALGDWYSINLTIKGLTYGISFAYYFFANDASDNWAIKLNITNFFILTIGDSITPSAGQINFTITFAPNFILENTFFTISGGTDFGGTGIDYYQYKLDAGQWQIGTEFVLSKISDGNHLIQYRAVDLADNEGIAQNITVYLLRNEADYDKDGVSNSAELYIYRTDLFNPDSDFDGLSDGAELFIYKTNPNDPDTDDDGISDGQETILGADPLEPTNPLIGIIFLIIEINGIIISGCLVVFTIKRGRSLELRRIHLDTKETPAFTAFRSIICALPSLYKIFIEREKLKIPRELQSLSPVERFTFLDTIIGWASETEIKLWINSSIKRFELIEKLKPIVEHFKTMLKSVDSTNNRDLLNKLMQLIVLFRLSAK